MKNIILFVFTAILSMQAMAKDWKAAEANVVIWLTNSTPCSETINSNHDFKYLGTVVRNGIKSPICWAFEEKQQAIFFIGLGTRVTRGLKVGLFTAISESEGRMYSHVVEEQSKVNKNNQMAKDFQ